MLGTALVSKLELIKDDSSKAEKDNPQAAIISEYLIDVKNALANHDIGFLEERIKGNEFEMTKDDYKALAEYFTDNESGLNKFISCLNNQIESYLAGKILDSAFFYLDDVDGKVCIKVNHATVRFLPWSSIDEYIIETEDGKSHSREIDEDGGFTLDKLLPLNTKVTIKAGEWSEKYEYDFIKDFCRSKGKSESGTRVLALVFKRGAGVSISVCTNVEEAKLYINGKATDIKIGIDTERIDGLKEGDTLRAEYKGERSKEYKVRKTNNMAQLDFDIVKEEERFGVPKSDVDSGEVIAKNLLNSVSNGVNAQDADVLANIVDSSISAEAHNIVNDLINKYTSLSFTNVSATSASKSGSRLDMKLSYSYETISSLGSETIQNGSMSIVIDLSSAKVLGFTLN